MATDDELRNLRDQIARLQRDADERRQADEAAAAQFRPRTLRDFHSPRADNAGGPILLPMLQGDPPNYGTGVVNLIQQNCFHGLENENPHEHLNIFLQCCSAVKNVAAGLDYVRLSLFPFSLRDRARAWFFSLPQGSIRSWDELSAVFMEKYYPMRRTVRVRSDISSFKQGFDESLSEAWDRFNGLLRSCPHHNFSDWILVDAFYEGLNAQNQVLVDYSAGGSIIDREPREVLNLFEKLAHQQQWSNREPVRTIKGRHKVDQMMMLNAKLDALQLQLNKQNTSTQAVQLQVCALCRDESHDYDSCPLR